jgi:hypothetical protein
LRYVTRMANKPSGHGIFFSKPWSERPLWSKRTDVINVTLAGVVLLIVIWDAARRWFGY